MELRIWRYDNDEKSRELNFNLIRLRGNKDWKQKSFRDLQHPKAVFNFDIKLVQFLGTSSQVQLLRLENSRVAT